MTSQMASITPFGRLEMFRHLRVLKDGPDVDAKVEDAYVSEEARVWAMQHDDTAEDRGAAWHTSLHVSQLPTPPRGCVRSMLYSLMNIPEKEPFSPLGRSVMDIGKQLEYQIVYRMHRAGITVSGSCPTYDGYGAKQTTFVDYERWVAGSMDVVLDIRPEWLAALPLDVKGKDHQVIDQMRAGARSYDLEHYSQIQGYIHYCRVNHEAMGWADMGLQPATAGIIFYASRQRPRHTCEFFVRYDPFYVAWAMDHFDAAREHFKAGTLPPRDKAWRWTEDPCNWCEYKKFACKPDTKADVEFLADSGSLTFARDVNPTYDYELSRKAVLDRWKE